MRKNVKQPKLDFESRRSLSQHLYNRGKRLLKAGLDRVDTRVIVVKGWVESKEEKEHRVDSPG